MRLIISHQNGVQELGILGGFIGSQVRVFVPGAGDAVAFTFEAGRWIAGNGDAVQIRFGVPNNEFDALLNATAGESPADSSDARDLNAQPWFLMQPRPAAAVLVH